MCTMNTSVAKRDPFIDILKTLSIIMIIITHDTFFVENNRLPFCVYVLDMAVPVFMLVSGYNYASSCSRHKYSLRDLYDIKLLFRRICRFLVPYTAVFILVTLLMVFVKGNNSSLSEHLTAYIRGGYGPGAYYTPVMIQFVILSPLLYAFIETFNEKALIISFVLNLVFETALTLGLPWPGYSRTLLRYLFLITVGMYAYKHTYDNSKYLLSFGLISFLLGAFYLTYTQYLSHPVIFTRWTTTSMISTFYIVPIILLLKFIYNALISDHLSDNTEKEIATISSATFHIYLTQMTYYYIGISRFIPFPVGIRIVISILICVPIGVLFYMINKLIMH